MHEGSVRALRRAPRLTYRHCTYCTAESFSSVWHMELSSIRIALRVSLGVCIARTRAGRLQDIGKRMEFVPFASMGGCEWEDVK